MKKIFILFPLLLLVMCLYAQNKTIDSLKQALSVAKEDTSTVDLLHSLSALYTWSFADTAQMYGLQGLQLSQKLNYKTGEAWAMESLCIALTPLGNYARSLDFGYKALALFRELNDTLGLVAINSDLGTCYMEQGDYKKAIPFLKEGLRLTILQGSVFEKL